MAQWGELDIPDLSGKTALVTGANSGLGLATAQALAARGAEVVLAGIDDDATERAMQKIIGNTPGAKLHSLALDLSDIDSVQSAADTFLSAHSHLHILVNNAGVFGLPYGQTKQGFERVFGINHLGHFAFTGLLLDALRATPGARIVTVTSVAHRSGKLPLDDLNWQKRRYVSYGAYSQSKLANMIFALELDRRLRCAQIDAISLAAHPGYAATNIFFSGGVAQPSYSRRFWNRFAKVGAAWFAQPAELAALSALYAATKEDVTGSELIGPGGLMEFRGYPKSASPSELALDPALASALWQQSELMTGVKWL